MFFVQQIITSSLLIAVIIAARALFGKYMSQRLKYTLWLLVAIKLFVPVPFDNQFNVANYIQGEEQETVASRGADDFGGAYEIQTGQIAVDEADIAKHGEENTGKVLGKGIDAANKTADSKAGAGENGGSESISGQSAAGKGSFLTGQQSPEEAEIRLGKSMLESKKLREIILSVWIAGAFVVGIIFLLNNVIFSLRLKKSRRYCETYENKLPVYATDQVESPCLFGNLHPGIYLPEQLESEGKQREYILLHEWTHYCHGDSLWAILRCLCVVVYWFHPLVWVSCYLSIRDSELACDEGVVARIGSGERKAYGTMLLELCENFGGESHHKISLMTTEMIGGKHEMKDRISLLVSNSKHKVAAAVMTFGVAVLAAGCTFGSGVKTTEGVNTVSGSAGKAETEQKDENYYSTHSEEEIKKDVEKQLKLLQDSADVWNHKTETDAHYAIADFDQNGRLEIVYNPDLSGQKEESGAECYEVNEAGDGLTECAIEGAVSPDFSNFIDNGQNRAFFDEKADIWHYRAYPFVKSSEFQTEQQEDDVVVESSGPKAPVDLWKEGSTIHIEGDGETNLDENYYEGMVRAKVSVSWFRTCFGVAEHEENESPEEAMKSDLMKSEINFQAMQISAKEFEIKKERPSEVDYEKIYTQYARSLRDSDSSGKKKYMAIVESDQPVLLIADTVMTQEREKDIRIYNAVSAEVYGYSEEKGKVVKVGKISGTGSGYPILINGWYLETGYHHSSDRLRVDGGVGTIERVEGLYKVECAGKYYKKADGKYSKISLENGKEKVLEQIELPYYVAETMDYYINGYGEGIRAGASAEEVRFEKVK